MDGQIGAAIEQAGVQLLGPQGLAAQIGERTVLDHVARGGDRHDLGCMALRLQGVGDEPCLGERQRRAAGADAKGPVHRALVLAALPVAGKPR